MTIGWLGKLEHVEQRLRGQRRAFCVVAVLALMATLLGGIPSADADPGDMHTFSGTITAADGGGALSGMTVSVFCIGCEGSRTDPSGNPDRPWPVSRSPSEETRLLGEGTTGSSGSWSVTVSEPSSGRAMVIAWDPNGDYALSVLTSWGSWTDAEGLDAALSDGGRLSGRILADGVAPPPAGEYLIIVGSARLGIIVADDGSYATPGLADGDYSLTYPSDLPAPFVAGLNPVLGTISDGEDVEVDHELAQRVSLSGSVTDGSGQGLGGITVIASRVGGSGGSFVRSAVGAATVFRARTEDDGSYSIDSTVGGTIFAVKFSSPDGEYATEYYDDQASSRDGDAVEVPLTGGVSNIDAQLAPGSTISGRVKDPLGLLVRDYWVRLCQEQDSDCQVRSAPSSVSGEFEFTGLVATTYELTVSRSGLASAEKSVELSEGSNRHVDVTMDGGRISGVVTDSEGAPVVGLRVRFGFVGSAVTARDGSYTSPLLAEGEYRVSFGEFDRDFDREGVMVVNGEITSDIDARLDAGFIEGTVTSGAKALVDVRVSARKKSSFSDYFIGNSGASTTTAADGTYRLAVGDDGDYRVEFSSPWHVDEYYDDGDTVAVAVSATTSGIDADLAVPPPTPPPEGTEVSGGTIDSNGIPSFGGSDTITISHKGLACARRAILIVRDLIYYRGGISSLAMSEMPVGSGTYSVSLPVADLGVAGRADVTVFVFCEENPIFGPSEVIEFSVYVDPSGTVVDQNGSPVEGATVTLLRANPDTVVVDFEAVVDGSVLMDPAVNSTNPDVTGADGEFRWDVVSGLWKVRATAEGCHAPGDSSVGFVETAELVVPPPRLGLILELECESAVAEDASDTFEDIADGAYYESAVAWMIRNEITTGCSQDPALFCPGRGLKRAEFVTFLWRASGKPAPSQAGSAVFADVPVGHWADQAIGWAKQAEVTTGCAAATATTSARFCLDRSVTRAEIATLLHRFVDEPASTGVHQFSDAGPGVYYSEPVAWTAEHMFIEGCSATTFCPDQPADRATAATFIHGVATNPQSWATQQSDFQYG